MLASATPVRLDQASLVYKDVIYNYSRSSTTFCFAAPYTTPSFSVLFSIATKGVQHVQEPEERQRNAHEQLRPSYRAKGHCERRAGWWGVGVEASVQDEKNGRHRLQLVTWG